MSYDEKRKNGANFASKSVRNIEVSAISNNSSAVVALLSAKSRFLAKTVSVKPSFYCIVKLHCEKPSFLFVRSSIDIGAK